MPIAIIEARDHECLDQSGAAVLERSGQILDIFGRIRQQLIPVATANSSYKGQQ